MVRASSSSSSSSSRSASSSSSTLFTCTLVLLLALLNASLVSARPASSDGVAVVTVAAPAASASATSTSKAAAASSSSATPAKSTAVAAAASSTQSASTTFPTAGNAAVSPLGSSSDMFVQGQACRASWTPAAASSTAWKSMTIDLMTGSNLQMVKLATVAAGLDGTDPNVTTYNYTCPLVSPNAAIYFLQYTHDDGLDPTWTTRFAIANSAGIYFPAPEANQPQGGTPAIPWGKGTLIAATSDDSTSSSTVVNQNSLSASDTTSGGSPSYRRDFSLVAVLASVFAATLGFVV